MRTRKDVVLSLSAMAVVLMLPLPVAGQDASELAKQTQNPIANLISVPIQGNWDFGIGDNKDTSTLLNIQPVVPFGVSRSTNVILRVIMPLTSQPGTDGARNNGMGDIVASAFFSPIKSGRIIWGAGPVVLLPTATANALGAQKFGVGPTVVVLTQPGQWTLGTLFNQIWSTSGATNRDDVNLMYLQPFANYNLGSGLAVGVSMEATANLERGPDVDGPAALSGEQSHTAWQTAGEFGGRRGTHGCQPGWEGKLAVSTGGHLPVSAMSVTNPLKERQDEE